MSLFALSPLSRLLVCVPHGSAKIAEDARARTFEAGIAATVAASSYGVALARVCTQTAKLSHPLNDVITAQGDLQDYVHPRDPSGFKKMCDAIWPDFLNVCGYDAAWSGLAATTSRGWPLGTCPVGSKITPALTGTIKVMCIGDSITLGHGAAPGDSFRCLLKARATAYGLTTDFIGARANGTCADNNHNAVSGWSIEQQDADIATRFGVLPDVIIVHLGTNNFINGNTGLAAMATFLG